MRLAPRQRRTEAINLLTEAFGLEAPTSRYSSEDYRQLVDAVSATEETADSAELWQQVSAFRRRGLRKATIGFRLESDRLKIRIRANIDGKPVDKTLSIRREDLEND